MNKEGKMNRKKEMINLLDPFGMVLISIKTKA